MGLGVPDDGGGEFALVVVPERVRPETLVHLLKGQPGAFGFLLGRVRAVALAPGVVPAMPHRSAVLSTVCPFPP